MRLNAAVAFILLAFIAGCTGPAGLKTADDLRSKKDYLAAVEAYDQVLETVKDDATRRRIEEKLAETKVSLVDEYLFQADEQYLDMGKASLPSLNRILTRLRSIQQWDDAEGRISSRVASYRKEVENLQENVDGYLRQAVEAARSFKYDTALQKIDAAEKLEPGSSAVISARIRLIEQQVLYNEVLMLLTEKDIDGAARKFHELAATYNNPQPSLADAPYASDALALIVEKVRSMTAENRWVEAIDFLKGWKLPELAELTKDISRGTAGYFLSVAKVALEEGKDGKAYLYSVRAADLDPSNMEIFQVNKRARDAVNKEIQSYIAVASFDTPSDDPDAGKQFSDSLISFLYQELPYGVNILERDKIDYVLKEQRNEASKVSDVLGVDLVVTGTVSLFRVESSVDERKATVKVSGNEEIVVNPVFTQMHQLYGPDTSVWPEVPEKTIKKVDVERIHYTKGTGRKKGFAKVSVRIFDTDKGTITFVKDYNASVSKVSEFQDEVAEAGIEYIPLSLPSDTELKEEMRRGIVQELAKVVQASFERRELRFLNQVHFFLDRRETEEALTPLAAGYLYCLQDGINRENPEFLEFTRMMEEFVR